MQLLGDLVEALMRHTEPPRSFSTVDRIAAAESGAGKECIEALSVLA
jgi:hypothetical protein